MKSSTLERPSKAAPEATPQQVPPGDETQSFGTIARLPNGLADTACQAAARLLNLILADTITIRDLYKKHHWQVAGPHFYQFHLLFDKHYEAQAELVDAIAERIQMLGGIAIAMAHDVAERTQIPRPPLGREEVPVQISRLLEAHELIVRSARSAAKELEDGDPGTTDLLISQVLRTNEMQIWFLSEHLVRTNHAADSSA
jgi:starvation-inducible DNA-binding protein